jgi:hypothetical protein
VAQESALQAAVGEFTRLMRPILVGSAARSHRSRPNQDTGFSPWVVVITGLVLLVIDWRLALGVGASWGTGRWLRHTTPQQRQQGLAWLRQHRSTGMTVGAIALPGLTTFLAAALWQSLDNSWIAFALISQGVISALTLALVAQQAQQIATTPPTLEQQVLQLQDEAPLVRLVTLRQVTQQALAATGDEGVELRSHLTDCLRLCLRREAEPGVRLALRRSLEQLQATDAQSTPTSHQLPAETRPVVRIETNQPQRQKHAVVEYVTEYVTEEDS